MKKSKSQDALEGALTTILEPIVRMVVDEVASRMKRLGDSDERMGVPEPKAAALLGIKSHVLRDARRRGEISGRRVGRSVVYSRAALVKWLEAIE